MVEIKSPKSGEIQGSTVFLAGSIETCFFFIYKYPKVRK